MTVAGRRPICLPNGSVLSPEDQRKLSWPGGHSAGWLQRLPEVLAEWCDRWQVTLDPGIPAINFNLVLFGTSPVHGPVAIKTAPPHEEVTAEIETLRRAQRPGIVRLYDSDPSVSIMLQERVLPGTMLRQQVAQRALSDTRATMIAAECMLRFWRPTSRTPGLIPLDRWFQALYSYREGHPDGSGPIPPDIVDLAIHHADHLLATEQERYTVHGDLNPGNILWSKTHGWTIIDPKGLVGERGYEVGQWMLNPYGLHRWPNLEETLDARLSLFANILGLDRHRLWRWAIAHAVLSECWTVGAGLVDAEGLHSVEIAHALLRLPDVADGS